MQTKILNGYEFVNAENIFKFQEKKREKKRNRDVKEFVSASCLLREGVFFCM